ncbi:filamin/ABP280 repeat domain-containing protein, partial [Salmonella sp. s51228]|uniref:filamin/ABP280 repeat domain-containing protein n=1 Tax=Salmonella sp. s51228 TaxID=3159652 RepID=UPI0039812B12
NELNGEYIPRQAGEYEVDIDMEGYAIPGSPFKLTITDPSKVKLEGPALKHAFVNKPTYVNVITSDTKPVKVVAKVIDPNRKQVPVTIKQAKG